ncbi:natural resistance-associated macrophage protein-domain-containing protein [Globomyces pollinis-pini]|nr:natural resistance-associated macrophage protein-domain-containing protein [Globomyces pollinis-pini]
MQQYQSTLDDSKHKTWKSWFKSLLSFIGPGFMIAVGYLDPGNWATDLAAGSQFGYKLLFIIFLANLMAILLQSLCIRLGVITGLDLAQSCRKFLPRPLCYFLYVLCELAIMATDLAEVIGSAIALNLLTGIPLFWGIIITAADVMVLLAGWNHKNFRIFEVFIMALVLITAGCLFAVTVKSDPVIGDVLFGYLPSPTIITNPDAVFLAVGIIGATVMPHNLYLHSSIVKYRANQNSENFEDEDFEIDNASTMSDTQPLSRNISIPNTLSMSNTDSVMALLFALLVNSSILIIAASNFYYNDKTDVAEIPDAYRLIREMLGYAFATLFAFALLLSGQSSTITGTMAGQIVMEGFLGGAIKLKPWVRRLVTRVLAIGPALICITYYGESRLNDLLILSQIILSLQLPFAVWPLIYFTSSKGCMTIKFRSTHIEQDADFDIQTSPSTDIPLAIFDQNSFIPASKESSNVDTTSVRSFEEVGIGLNTENKPVFIEKCYTNDTKTFVLAVIVGLMLTTFNCILLVQVATSGEK